MITGRGRLHQRPGLRRRRSRTAIAAPSSCCSRLRALRLRRAAGAFAAVTGFRRARPRQSGLASSGLPRRTIRLHGRHRNDAGQERPRRDAQGRRDHGRHRRRAGARSPRTPAPSRSWRSSASRPTSASRAASRAWPTRTRSSEIQEAVTIPVMAKCRIGHFVEAQILEALEVDYIDESEVLTPADIAAPRRQVEASRCRSSAAARTSARRCGGSPRARR